MILTELPPLNVYRLPIPIIYTNNHVLLPDKYPNASLFLQNLEKNKQISLSFMHIKLEFERFKYMYIV